LPSGSGSGSLTGFDSFVGIDRGEFAVNVSELAFKLLLLVGDLLACSVQSLAFPGNKVGEGWLAIGLSSIPGRDYRRSCRLYSVGVGSSRDHITAGNSEKPI